MLSHRHESLLLLFRNRSTLAAESLDVERRIKVPRYVQARIDSADLTDIQPAEYRADLVVTLVAADGTQAMSIIVEVQLAVDERKRWVWPAYVANLRARLKCPVILLVVTLNEAVARWASKPIEMGGESVLVPVVLGPAEIAEITDWEEARVAPERSVLSAMAHGRIAESGKAVEIAKAALHAVRHVNEDLRRLYSDLVYGSLSENNRKEFQSMTTLIIGGKPYEYEFQSDFGKYFPPIGGRISLIMDQLAWRFGPLSEEVQNRILDTSFAEQSAIAQRLLTASTVEEALGIAVSP